MSYYGWAPYVSVAARRKKAEKAAAKAKKSGAGLSPIEPSRGAIAKTFWGKAWCDNLERYSDYANRLPRGRSYARNGSVIDLKITEGAVLAQVMGSSLYRVAVKVTAVPVKHWQAIGTDCAGSIDSLVELLQGETLHRCDAAHLHAADRAFSGAEGNQLQLQLPGLGLDVQTHCGRALRGGCAPG